MKKIAVLNYIFVVLIIVSNYSCSNHKETKYILKQAETVMEEHPDSAYALLDKLEGEKEGLPQSLRMRYELLRAQSMNKTDVPFTSDSVLLRVAQYYDKNVQIQAERLKQTEFSKGYCKYRTLFTLNNGNLCNVISFLMNLLAFFAVKADIRFIYGNNYNSWSEGNFEDQKVGPGIIDGDRGGLIEYNNLDKSQWNHNKCSIVFARTLLDIIFQYQLMKKI